MLNRTALQNTLDAAVARSGIPATELTVLAVTNGGARAVITIKRSELRVELPHHEALAILNDASSLDDIEERLRQLSGTTEPTTS